jgi:hypothetical protein
MKTFIAIIFMLSANYYANAQLILHLYVDPPNTTNADSITIIAPIAFLDGCHKLDSSIMQNGNTFIINACYNYGWGEFGFFSYDTARYHLGILSNGTYTVKYIVHATRDDSSDVTCSHYSRADSTTKIFTVGPTGILGAPETSLVIFPNPAKDKLRCSFSGPEYRLQYEIFAIDARRYLQGHIAQPNFEIDVSALPSGLYFLQLQSEGQNLVKKVVKY